ncbi:MAG: M1 family metallopeptidase [Acidobacteriota bacterium]
MDRRALVLALLGLGSHGALAAQTDRYELSLQPDFDFFTFHGSETVRFENRTGKPLAEVPLSLYPNARALVAAGSRNLVVREVTLGGKTAAFDAKGTVLRVTLAPPVAAGSIAELAITFDGILPRMKEGESSLLGQGVDQLGELFGMASKEGGDYGILAYGDGTLSFGNWYPQLCPWVDGAFRTPEESTQGDMSFAEAADYQLTVRVPKGVVVAASGAQVRETPLQAGLVELVFDLPQGRNVAVEMSRDLAQSHTKSGNVTVTSYYKKADAEHGTRVMEHAAKALAFYEKAFGPYPWTELDVVEAPLKGGAGGVEFTGLVTCSSGLYGQMEAEMAPLLSLLGTVGGDSPTGEAGAAGAMPDLKEGMGEMLEFVVAHEVAHQWWNAAVGSDSQRSPFLDEALANFSALRYFAYAHGDAAAERQRELQLAMAYQLHRAFGGEDHAVDAPASSFAGPIAYSAIVYGKGGLFFEELVKRYGEKPVLAALSSYYRDGLHQVRRSPDLERALTSGLGKKAEVAALWQRWIVETHGDEDIGQGALGEMLRGSGLGDLLGNPALKGDGQDLQDLGKVLEELLGEAASSGESAADPGGVEPEP